MSSTPREIGTLIAVILKAKNLPNKRHIGKQDPYCVVNLNGEKRRTKAVRRGGQHPEWDEEVRFTLYEDIEDELARTANGADTPPRPPPKDSKASRKIKGAKTMRLSCYAEDPREPDLIGETVVDLTEVLTKGETDEWFTIMNKDKYCGEVYLELTFWSNEAPPEKKKVPKPTNNKQYGGTGMFVPFDEVPASLSSGPGTSRPPGSRIDSTGSSYDSSRFDSLPSSLRSSHSLAQLQLYNPAYEQESVETSAGDRLANDFGEMHVSDPRRRESFPPLHGGYSQSSTGFSTISSHSSHSSFTDTQSSYAYEPSGTPTGHSPHRNSTSSMYPPAQYQPAYEGTPPPSTYSSLPQRRVSRYSVPTSSSGFMPLHQQGAAPSSSFSHLPSHASEPSGFSTPPMAMPHAGGYGAPQGPPPTSYGPPSSQTPAPSGFIPPMPPPSAAGFHHYQDYPAQGYPPYAPVPPASAPPMQYLSPGQPPQPQPPASVPPPSHSVPPQPQQYNGYESAYPPPETQSYMPPQVLSQVHTPPQPAYAQAPPSPPSQDPIPPPPPPPTHSSSSSSISSTGSRPLPQQPPGQAQPSVYDPNSSRESGPYSPTLAGGIQFPTASPYNGIPPPPPPPSQIRKDSSPKPGDGQQQQQGSIPLLPPPPPPPPLQFHNSLSRRSGLPQPPVNDQQGQPQPYQSLPPPPPPPHFPNYQHTPPAPPPPQMGMQGQSYSPGPPPRPPGQGSQWMTVPPQGGYPQY